MRFGPKITDQICEELIKMPNIRYVCNKVGIDHSTFYRWMTKHYSFYIQVMSALAMGRDRMNDAAEGVIISGIQAGEMKSATYWLAHNEPRYASPAKARYLDAFNATLVEILEKPRPNDSQVMFETMFDSFEVMEKSLDAKEAKKIIDGYVKFAFREDMKLEEIFYASYSEWKTSKDEYKRRKKIAQAGESEIP